MCGLRRSSHGKGHPFGWVWRTAWRDARGSRAKALLYGLSMAIGMAALVAMMSFGSDLEGAVTGKAREMLGADLVVSARQPFDEKAEALIAGLGGERAEQQRFATMAHFIAQDEALLVRVRAIEGNYPFYGNLETDPATAGTAFRDGAQALVDASLIERVGATVGQKVKLGQATFTIAGILLDTPGESASASLMGPRIYIPKAMVEETGLIQFGSRVFYSMAFRLPQTQNADEWVSDHEAALRDLRLRTETVSSLEAQLGESMARLRDFLSLAACLALLLGGLGVASAVHYHLKQKATQIAVMRCLGATLPQVMWVYLLQVTALTGIATALGAGFGLAIQFYLPSLVKSFIPFDFESSLQPGALAISVGWGLLLSLLLALAPLLRIRHISPLATMRVASGPSVKRDRLAWLAYAMIAIVWWLFAAVQSQSAIVASWFLGGLLTSIGLLALVARGLTILTRKLLTLPLPFSLRHGLSGLFRPQNHTTILTIILGVGVLLLAILAGSRAMLLSQFEMALEGDRPNFIAFDVQADQVEGVQSILRDQGFPAPDPVPLVPMRLLSIKGEPVENLMGGDIPDWMLQREYRSTYRAEMTDTETLADGEWIGSVSPDATPVPVSLDEEIAGTFNVGIGDGLEVDVMGVPLALEIKSLRHIEWQSMQPNFYMVFPNGVLEDAPQMNLFATKTEGSADVGRLQRALVKAYPNVTCVDMTRIAKNIEAILDKASMVVRFLAGLCMVTGLLLLGSSLWNSRYQRLGEHALLQTLGARRGQVLRIALAEFMMLGVFAALAGVILGGTANWALAKFLFKLDVPMTWWPLVLPLVALPLLTALIGFLGQVGMGQRPAFTVLREEGQTA